MVKEILQKYIANKQSFTIKLLGDIICMIGTNNRHQNKFMYDLLVDAFGV